MKKIIILILGLWGLAASGQTVGQFRYDTTKFLKVGGRNHVKIENLIQTSDSVHKPLVAGADGVIKRSTYWPGSGGGGGISRAIDSTYRNAGDSGTVYRFTNATTYTILDRVTKVKLPCYVKLKGTGSPASLYDSLICPIDSLIAIGVGGSYQNVGGVTGGFRLIRGNGTSDTILINTGSTEYLVKSWGVLVDSVGRVYTLKADSNFVQKKLTAGTNITIAGDGTISAAGGGGGSVTSVSGTTNRITSTGGATPIIDIGADVVTLTGTQTVTNKTLTSPVLNVGSDATGDMYYRNAGLLTKLGIGTSAQRIAVVGGVPVWRDTAAAGGGSGWSLNGNTIATGDFLGGINNRSFRIRTNNIERVYIDSSTGNVGIGVTTAVSGLTIDRQASGASTVSLNLFPSSFSGGLPAYGIGLGPTGTVGMMEYRAGTISSGIFGHKFYVNNIPVMTVTGAGNVGIGTTNPGFPLSVLTAANTTAIYPFLASPVANDFVSIAFGGGGANQKNSQIKNIFINPITSVESDLAFETVPTGLAGTATVERMRIKFNGNVLLGTTTDQTSSIFTVGGSTKGSIPIPRMITTSRDSITTAIVSGTLVAGTGYTNGSYTNSPLTGGSGTGALATITVSGGGVTVFGLSGTGTGYGIGDVLSSSSIGGGSGFTYTVTGLTGTKGIQVYDTSTNNTSVYNGLNWNGGFVTSGAGTLTIKHGVSYVFTGSTSTWTLPVVSATILGRQNSIVIKNRGSGTLILNSNSGSTIYSTSAVGTINVLAGAACELMPDGTYFNIMYNQ